MTADPCPDTLPTGTPSLTPVRAAIWRTARGIEGLTADPARPEDYARYLDLIATGETPARSAEMARASGCALVAAGILRAVLAECPEPIAPPYRTGAAVANLERAARTAGAHRAAGAWREIGVGDVVCVGEPSVHVYTVLEAGSADVGAIGAIVSIDGGQRTEAGIETICRFERGIVGGVDKRHGAPDRPVLWWIDADAMGRAYGVRDV